MTIHIGNCLGVMAMMDADKFDSIVTDPPYGLGFMGKEWDHDVPGVEFWAQALRVAKPGAHLLAFGGTRKFHRMACAIEDAGWEIRDTIMWVYGSGFPKGRTVLKPAWEPIIMARKKGAGVLNIDDCRVPANGDKLGGGHGSTKSDGWDRPWKHDPAAVAACIERGKQNVAKAEKLGRWPANLIHDGSDEVLACFPEAPGQQGEVGPQHGAKESVNTYGDFGPRSKASPRSDAGSAARFFYCAKASRADRDERNNHPTVKPTDLMRYLCRLVTPKGGVILDPFAGSGSTGKAAILEGFKFVGIELNPDYAEIAKLRLSQAKESLGLGYFFDNSC
jgi:DNA modification methylase